MRFILLIFMSLFFCSNVNAEEYDLSALIESAIDQRCDETIKDFCLLVTGEMLEAATTIYLDPLNVESSINFRASLYASHRICMEDFLKDVKACMDLIEDLNSIALTVLEASILKHYDSITPKDADPAI